MFYVFYNLWKWFFSSNLVQLDLDPDPDPHSDKLLDLDPHKMNADPQPCGSIKINNNNWMFPREAKVGLYIREDALLTPEDKDWRRDWGEQGKHDQKRTKELKALCGNFPNLSLKYYMAAVVSVTSDKSWGLGSDVQQCKNKLSIHEDEEQLKDIWVFFTKKFHLTM